MNSYLQMWTHSSKIILPDSWGIAPMCSLKKKSKIYTDYVRNGTKPPCMHCKHTPHGSTERRAHERNRYSPFTLPSISDLPPLGMSEDTPLPIPFNILADAESSLCLPLNNIPEATQHFVGFFDHHTLAWQF